MDWGDDGKEVGIRVGRGGGGGGRVKGKVEAAAKRWCETS